MIELKKTGFMSNRGRQNVASYFAKNMMMDWRMGAAYFENRGLGGKSNYKVELLQKALCFL